MYEEFYGLTGKPFSLLPDSDFLYLSQRHSRVMNLLTYGLMTQAGFIVITGEVGTGKTMLIRRFLKTADNDITVGVLTNTSANLGSLLGWVATSFDLPCTAADPTTLYNNIVDFLVKEYAKGRRVVLIIDEAQNLPADKLEDLRMISNVNNEKDQLLQIILVGQPELLDTLKRHDLRQFVQRISVHCRLEALEIKETRAYLRHRLSVVGGNTDIFDSSAAAAIHYFSGGIPRLINLLADFSLVYGFSEDKKIIRLRDVLDVVQDRAATGLSAFRDWPAEGGLHKALSPILKCMINADKE